MKIINKIGLPKVVDFIHQRLTLYDTSNLDWVKLLPLNQQSRYHGHCEYPKRTAPRKRSFVHQYRIKASVNVNPAMWPYKEIVNVGTWQKEVRGMKLWGYEEEEVILQTVEEAVVFVLA